LPLNKEQQAAYAYAARLLSGREYCAEQIRAKLLLREFDADCISLVLSRLVDDGYLSETRFAEAFLRYRLKKGEVPWLAALKARQKGVDEQVLQVALEEAETGFDKMQACRDVLSGRDPQGLRHHEKRVWQRQARFLQNKGFDTATILRVMNESRKSDDYE
jgi:regulatory protein